MSVPIQSDGMAKYILEYMSKGWTPAEQYVSKFLSPAKGPFRDAIRGNPGVFRPPKLPNQQLYDTESYPIVTELPDGYALLSNADMGGTLGIFGHPSGQSFKNALDFLPHFQWLGSRDVANTRCLCRLCTIIYQQEDFIRQATILSESPNNSYISPFGQMGLKNNSFDNASFDENSFFPSLDMSGMQSNMNGMQSNMTGIQSNMNGMQSNMTGIQSNMNGMQSNMNGMQSDIANLLGSLNDNIISPDGLTSPMELFPSHLSNLSQIPLQKSFSLSPNHRMLFEDNHEQPLQNITQSSKAPQPPNIQVEAPEPLVESQPQQPQQPSKALSERSVELSPKSPQSPQSPQSSVQLSPQSSVQLSPQSSLQHSPRSTIDHLPRSPIEPSPQSPIDSSPHAPSKTFPRSPVKTPLFAIQEQPTKNASLKPPRKPRAKKAKRSGDGSSSTIPHHGMTSPTTVDEQSVQRSIPRTRISSPKSDGPPLVTIEDSLIDQNVLQLRTANEELGKDISMLVLYIKRYEKKIGRLKFERRLILNSVTEKKTQHAKRYRTDTSDSVGTESEPLQTDDIVEGKERLLTLGSTFQSKLKRPRKKRIKLLDPNAPKRPANAFIMFCDLQRLSINSERRLLQKLDPESEECKSMGQLTKALGSKWRNLNEDERKEYQDMYHEQVEWYDIEIKLYLAAHPNAPKEGNKGPLPDDWTDLNAPKRPANPFFVFCELEDERLKKLEEEAGTINGENGQSVKSIEEDREELNLVSMALITRWRNLEERQRKEYVDEYEARLEVYNSYMSTKKTTPNGAKSGHFNQPNLDSGEEEDELDGDDEPEVASLFKFDSSPILNFSRPED